MQLWRITENTFQLRVFHKQFMGLTGNGIDIVAVAKTPGESETFEIVKGPRNSSRVRIKAPNGSFLQVFALLFLNKAPCRLYSKELFQ